VPYLPFTSVIIPAYNAADTIGECVESVLRLDYPRERVDVIVVDNGSTDETAAIVRRSRDIRVVHEPRRGPAAARNAGLRASDADVVAFIDADSTVDERWLRNLVAPLEHHSARLVGGSILSRRPCNYVERFGERIHDVRASTEVYWPPYVPTGNWAMRRVDDARFDESLRRCSDVDLSYRLFQAGYAFCFQPTAVVYHRNERTLRGLFAEAFQHGYYAVPVRTKHRGLLASSGRRSPRPVLRAAGRRDPVTAICAGVFDIGKVIGNITGSIRFAQNRL
jgi:glycosyltransferase involved in cell wall biosynthesis